MAIFDTGGGPVDIFGVNRPRIDVPDFGWRENPLNPGYPIPTCSWECEALISKIQYNSQRMLEIIEEMRGATSAERVRLMGKWRELAYDNTRLHESLEQAYSDGACSEGCLSS
jgi:hypothetical protein